MGAIDNHRFAMIGGLRETGEPARTCEGMADIFTILYVTNISGITLPKYGLLIAIQLATAIAVYVPAAKIADRIGRKPLVIATFIFFALFPVAVVLAHFSSLVVAFGWRCRRQANV